MIQVLFTWRSPQKSTERKSRPREGVRLAWRRSSRSCGTKSCLPTLLGIDINDNIVENVLVLLLPFPREVVTLIALERIVQTHILIGLNVLSLSQTNELVNKRIWKLCKGSLHKNTWHSAIVSLFTSPSVAPTTSLVDF